MSVKASVANIEARSHRQLCSADAAAAYENGLASDQIFIDFSAETLFVRKAVILDPYAAGKLVIDVVSLILQFAVFQIVFRKFRTLQRSVSQDHFAAIVPVINQFFFFYIDWTSDERV